MSPAARPAPLAGRTAVITGAGSGIGRALAERLSAAGSPVALADRDAGGLAATAAALRGPVLTRCLDVADRGAVTAFAAEVASWAPAPLGAVVNNAGVALVATVADGDPDDEAWLRAVNVDGVVHGTRAFLPALLAQGSGAVVNVSSVFGLIGVPTQSAYCAAKFAVRGFTESLRQELRGTGVRAVVVHPGGIRTPIFRSALVRTDPRGPGHADGDLGARAEARTLTSPQRAAAVIHRGIDRGRPRILIGPDAYAVDAMARLAPGHYDGVVAWAARRFGLAATTASGS